ncbi:5e579c69-7969-42de-a2a2-77611fb1fb10 [Thermothielavioides terrestris]|uniref:5e579c69-7969-42de-a2a2-77611fb1fb10 n=1 Tax=Thermothielavioides terrestris TaxID=2587410 RepID=A0A3S4EUF4_9PEZI|nr:5e579c69-7969-42de-a2a2-77611fb1fb10 [Thermothielavioides terrestris]
MERERSATDLAAFVFISSVPKSGEAVRGLS